MVEVGRCLSPSGGAGGAGSCRLAGAAEGPGGTRVLDGATGVRRGSVSRRVLLPEHTPGLDEEVSVKSATGELPLLAQGDWYQDLQFPDIDHAVRSGLIERAGEGRAALLGPDRLEIAFLVERQEQVAVERAA